MNPDEISKLIKYEPRKRHALRRALGFIFAAAVILFVLLIIGIGGGHIPCWITACN